MTTQQVIQWATAHPTELLLWTHGFGWALALRRGRIEALISRITPGSSGDNDGSSESESDESASAEE
jgi:hypothetical protein